MGTDDAERFGHGNSAENVKIAQKILSEDQKVKLHEMANTLKDIRRRYIAGMFVYEAWQIILLVVRVPRSFTFDKNVLRWDL